MMPVPTLVVGAQSTLGGAQISIVGARAPTKVYKSTPMGASTAATADWRSVASRMRSRGPYWLLSTDSVCTGELRYVAQHFVFGAPRSALHYSMWSAWSSLERYLKLFINGLLKIFTHFELAIHCWSYYTYLGWKLSAIGRQGRHLSLTLGR